MARPPPPGQGGPACAGRAGAEGRIAIGQGSLVTPPGAPRHVTSRNHVAGPCPPTTRSLSSCPEPGVRFSCPGEHRGGPATWPALWSDEGREHGWRHGQPLGLGPAMGSLPCPATRRAAFTFPRSPLALPVRPHGRAGRVSPASAGRSHPSTAEDRRAGLVQRSTLQPSSDSVSRTWMRTGWPGRRRRLQGSAGVGVEGGRRAAPGVGRERSGDPPSRRSRGAGTEEQE